MSEALAPKRIDAGSVSLERLSSDRIDLHDWYAFWCDCDPVVFDHLDLVPNQTLKTVANRVAALEDAWADAESFSYVVRRDDTLAGYADLQADWDRRAAEVGVVLDRPYWGEDIASDVVARLAAVGFDRLDIDLVRLTFDAGNDRALAAAEGYVDRFGGHVDGPFRAFGSRDGEPVTKYQYTVDANEFDATSSR